VGEEVGGGVAQQGCVNGGERTDLQHDILSIEIQEEE